MATLKKVQVLFSSLLNLDDYSGRYQIVVLLDEEQAADAEAAGLKVTTKMYQDKPQYQCKFKTKYKPPVVSKNPKVGYDMQGVELGRGSLINVQYRERPYKDLQGNSGIAHDLIAVQVLEAATGAGTEFDEYDEDEHDI